MLFERFDDEDVKDFMGCGDDAAMTLPPPDTAMMRSTWLPLNEVMTRPLLDVAMMRSPLDAVMTRMTWPPLDAAMIRPPRDAAVTRSPPDTAMMQPPLD